MQRNITYQDLVKYGLSFLALLFYEVLSSVYPLLPPLFGLAFLLFIRAVEKSNLLLLFFVIGYLFILEIDKEFLLFSSLIFFVIAYKFGLLKLRQIIQCEKCLDYIAIAIAYFGFWFFTIVLHQLLWIEQPSFDWSILYYVIIESLIVVFL